MDAEIRRLQRLLLAVVSPTVAGAMSCGGSPEDWPVCGEEAEVTAEDHSEYGSLPYGDFLVCGELPADGAECPDKDVVDTYAFFQENVGPTSDGDHGYDLQIDCGPETTRTDACCYVMEHNGDWVAGRPFGVRGCDRVAVVRGPANGWVRRGIAEHASIASFARFTLALLSLGAPSELVEASVRAHGDEIDHARRCFAIAARISGEAIAAGPLDVVGALDEVDPVSVAVALAREGCVAETVAAAVAVVEARRARADASIDAVILETLVVLAADEVRHAVLAWRAAAWLMRAYLQVRRPFFDAAANALAEMRDDVDAGSARALVDPLLTALAA